MVIALWEGRHPITFCEIAVDPQVNRDPSFSNTVSYKIKPPPFGRGLNFYDRLPSWISQRPYSEATKGRGVI